MKKFFSVLSNILTIILLVFVVAFIGLYVMGIKPYIVLSGSMEPTIHTGSICLINQKATYEDVMTNDVIAFKSASNQLVTHRVIQITDEGFETKGDNNDVSDGISTTKDNFVGLNVLTIPYLGYVSKFLQTRHGQIIVGASIFILIILSFIIKEISKKEE